MKKKGKRDTLEQIVKDAIKREKEINKKHPERKGYGMVQGEADEFIKRLRLLELGEEMAQRVKTVRNAQRIRLTANDKLYSKSPEEVAIINIYRERVNSAEKRVVDGLSEHSRLIYDMKNRGDKLVDIGKIVDRNASNVSRDFYKSMEKLKEEFIKVLGKEREE